MDFLTILTNLDHNSPLFYLVLAVLCAYKAFDLVKPLIAHKIGSAQMDKLTKRSEFVLNKAKLIAGQVANCADLSNDDRREKATDMLYNVLTEHGIKISRQDLYAFVEAGYRYMKNNNLLKDVPVKQTEAPENLTTDQLNGLIPGTTKPSGNEE